MSRETFTERGEMPQSKATKSALAAIAVGVLAAAPAYAQFGGGGADWNTAGANAQRTSWVKGDKFIAKDVIMNGDFQFQWKMKTENPSRSSALILGATASGGGLSKPMNVIYTTSNTLTTIDNDTGIEGWTHHFDSPVSSGGSACPAGMSAVGSRPTSLVPAAGSSRAAARPVVGYHSVVGEPGQGLPASVTVRGARPPAGAEFAAGAPAAANLGLTAAPPAGAPAAAAPRAGEGGGNRGVATATTYKTYFPGGRFGSNSGFFVLTSDGMLRTLADSNGVEVKAPVPFLAANARASDLTVIPENNNAWHAFMVYTSTADNCGGVPNRVWAINLADDSKPITHFDTGANPVGDLAFSEKGTVFVAVGKAPASAAYSNAVVALEPRTLTPQTWFSDPAADFASTPTVIKDGTKEIVAEVSKDGRIFLLDAATPGGADHKTALYVSPSYFTGKTDLAHVALASWVDAGVTYIAEPFTGPGPSGMGENGKVTNGGIMTLKLTDEDGKISLTPVWVSQDMTAPLTPIVINGVMFAASSGEAATKTGPAELYALDPANGKEMWSSGKTITSAISRTPLWSQGSQVYVGASDGYVYAFGPSLERYVMAKH